MDYGGATVTTSPQRVLYVVSRDRPDLYDRLRENFVESPRLGIVLDRRGNAMAPEGTERRHLALDEPLRTRGWARIRIESDGRASLVEGASS
jgi:hypothetical protein